MDVARLLEIALIVWLALLTAVVAGRILSDGTAAGLLATRTGSAGVNPERALTLGIFPAVLFYYVLHTLNTGTVAIDGRLSMPEIPENLIALLTGGNGLYLAGKIARVRGGNAS